MIFEKIQKISLGILAGVSVGDNHFAVYIQSNLLIASDRKLRTDALTHRKTTW